MLDVLLGNASQARSRTRQFRSLLHIKKEDVAAAIDISVSWLEEIEAGELHYSLKRERAVVPCMDN